MAGRFPAESGTIDLMSDLLPPTPATTNEIEAGDQLARSGDWRGAIDHWQAAATRSGTRREPVERRLAWLLRQVEPPRSPLKSRVIRLVIGSAAAALLGTVLVLVAGEPGSTSANLLAAVAWGCFIASATMALIAARGRTNTDLDDLLGRARTAADRLATRRHEDTTT